MNIPERKVVKAGYLTKSPPQDKLMAQWHRRYFILWSNKLMEYYTSHEHRPEDYLKTINLSMCEDMVAPLPITNRPHIIKLSIRAGGKLRDYYLDCGSESEMKAWVGSLAQVCAFCPVENGSPSTPGADEDQPIYNDIDDPPDSQPFGNTRPKLHLPIPSLETPASVGVVDHAIYDEPGLESDYHLAEMSDSFETTMDTRVCSEEWYDDLGVDDRVVYTMNKNPPPVWHPDLDALRKPPLPPDRRAASSEPEDRCRKPLLTSPLRSPAHRKPLPPPKPRPGVVISPASVASGAGLLGIKDDPKFKLKLQEKREELYGGQGAIRGRSLSMGEGEEFYESILYTGSDTRSPSPTPYEEGLRSQEPSPGPPSLPPKTATMLRESSDPSHLRSVPFPLPPSAPRDPPQRGVALPQPSPRHHKTNSSPITTPPPLPSRELVDPSRPPLIMSSVSPKEEAPPPVPLRQTSIPTSPPSKCATSSPLSPNKRGDSLLSPELAVARTSFTHTLAHLLVNAPRSPARKGQRSPPPGVVESFEGYEDVIPDQLEEGYEGVGDTEGHIEETYDDVTFTIGAPSRPPAQLPRAREQSFGDCPPVPPRDQQEHAPTPPPRDQQEHAPTPPPRDQQEHAPTPPPRDVQEHAPTPPPRDQQEHAPTPPPRDQRESRFHGRAGDAPQLPPNKPRAPDSPKHYPHSKRKTSDDAPRLPPNKPRVPDSPQHHSRSKQRTSDDAPQLPPNKPRAADSPKHNPHSKRRTSDDAPQLPPNKPRAADVGNGPLLPPSKPRPGVADVVKPSIKPRTSPPTPRARKGSAEGPSPDKSPRPSPAGKPPVSKKPVVGVSLRPHPASKKPAPPTQPKPKGLSAQPHSSSNLPPTKTRPKPAVPQKPVGLPLSSFSSS